MMHLQLLKYAVYQQEDIRLFCGPLGRISPVAFNESKSFGAGAWVHFFLEDTRFEAVWKNPLRYGKRWLDNPPAGLVGFDFYSVYVPPV